MRPIEATRRVAVRLKPRRPARLAPLGLLRGDRVFTVVILAGLGVVAAVAGSGSWQHQYEQAVRYHQAHWYAGMFPLSVDGLIVTATMVIWYAARHRLPRPWGAWLVLVAGIGATAIINLAPDYHWRWLGPAISVWPAVAFVAAYEMFVWLVRKRQAAAHLTRDDKPHETVTLPVMAHANGNGHKPTIKELAAREGVSVRTIQRRNARSTP